MAEGSIAIATLLWNMLSGLAQGYATQRKNFFEHHVEPLQSRMGQIHQDYIAGFEEVRHPLKNGTTPPDEVIEFLRERRRDYEHERQLSQHLAVELEKARKPFISPELWDAVNDYCHAIVEYFDASANLEGTSLYTQFIQMMLDQSYTGAKDVGQTSSIDSNSRRFLVERIDIILNRRLPKSFSKVSASYAVLRARLL